MMNDKYIIDATTMLLSLNLEYGGNNIYNKILHYWTPEKLKKFIKNSEILDSTNSIVDKNSSNENKHVYVTHCGKKYETKFITTMLFDEIKSQFLWIWNYELNERNKVMYEIEKTVKLIQEFNALGLHDDGTNVSTEHIGMFEILHMLIFGYFLGGKAFVVIRTLDNKRVYNVINELDEIKNSPGYCEVHAKAGLGQIMIANKENDEGNIFEKIDDFWYKNFDKFFQTSSLFHPSNSKKINKINKDMIVEFETNSGDKYKVKSKHVAVLHNDCMYWKYMFEDKDQDEYLLSLKNDIFKYQELNWFALLKPGIKLENVHNKRSNEWTYMLLFAYFMQGIGFLKFQSENGYTFFNIITKIEKIDKKTVT